MLRRVASGGASLRGLMPGSHSSPETSQRWRAVGAIVSDLTGFGIEPRNSGTDSDISNNCFNHSMIARIFSFFYFKNKRKNSSDHSRISILAIILEVKILECVVIKPKTGLLKK